MSHGGPVYEPRFYERAAQHHVARLFPAPVFVNVRWGLSGSLPTRHELDALAFRTRQAVPVEIKAHSLNNADTDEIIAKYRGIGFRHIVLVVPGTSAEVGRRLAEMKIPSVELVLFCPNLDAIRDWYCTWWPQAMPAWTHTALASGRHHVRFVLARPTERGRICYWSATHADLFSGHSATTYRLSSCAARADSLDATAFFHTEGSHCSGKQGYPLGRFCAHRHRR